MLCVGVVFCGVVFGVATICCVCGLFGVVSCISKYIW